MPESASGLNPTIVIPGAPLLVPELVGSPGDPEAARVRQAVLVAGAWLAERAALWRVHADEVVTSVDGSGTFNGYGADVIVTAAPGAPTTDEPPNPDWPLPMLLAAWVRGRTASSARVCAADDPTALTSSEVVGDVFVLDGPNTLTARAPGGHHPEDLATFAAQTSAIAEGAPADGLSGTWREAARAFADTQVDVLYRGAPFGVGYLVATGLPR